MVFNYFYELNLKKIFKKNEDANWNSKIMWSIRSILQESKSDFRKKIAINFFFPMALSFKHSLTAKVEGIFVKIQKYQNNFKPNALNLKYFIPCYQPWFLTFCTKNMILISHLWIQCTLVFFILWWIFNARKIGSYAFFCMPSNFTLFRSINLQCNWFW